MCQSSIHLCSIWSKPCCQWWPTQWWLWRMTLTAVSTNTSTGRGNSLNNTCCLMPSSFLLVNHIMLMIFCMIGALRKPWHLSCMSALCWPPHISDYARHTQWETSKPWMWNLHPPLILPLMLDFSWLLFWSGCSGNWTSPQREGRA